LYSFVLSPRKVTVMLPSVDFLVTEMQIEKHLSV